MSPPRQTNRAHRKPGYHSDPLNEADHRPRVLLVDDDADMLLTIAETLEGEFHVIGLAEDGSQALRAASRSPDIVVLDISMPDMSGIEVAAQIRKAGCEAKVVFLSMYDDPDFVEAAMSAALAYVVKPRLATDLLPALRNALEGRTFTSPSVHLPQNPGYVGPHS